MLGGNTKVHMYAGTRHNRNFWWLQAHAAVGVERHRLKEQCMQDPLPNDASLLPVLADRMTARILLAITGTSSQQNND